MFKLNPPLPLPTREYILSNISDYQIFKYYLNGYEPGEGAINSPLRHDSIPSFSVFYAERAGRLMFKDFASNQSGDCFVFVGLLYRISFKEALFKICSDFNLLDVYIPDSFNNGIRKKIPKISVDYSTINKKISLRVKTKAYTDNELEWWLKFGITKETLKRYNVFSLSKIYINEYVIPCNFSFGYLEFYNQQYYWKVYSPLEDRSKKWVNSGCQYILQGWTQMPPTGDILIITKGLKDSMSITESSKIASCSLQSETASIKQSVLNELKSRFNEIYLLLDCDTQGIKHSNELSKKHDLKQIFIPNEKWKDYSGMLENIGKEYSVKILNKLLGF